MRAAHINKDFVSGFLTAVVCCTAILFVGGGACLAATPAKLFAEANENYKQNRYAEAVTGYEQLLKDGYDNAELHYNLANSYYKANVLGKSILHYEKAHKLAPEDEDVIHNLKLANLRTTDKIISVPDLAIVTFWKQFKRTFNSNGWGGIAVGLVWAAFGLFMLYLFTEYRKTGFYLGVTFLIASLFCFWLRNRVQQCETGPNVAILLSKTAYVKSAPDETSTNLFMVHEGLKLQVKDKVGEWCKVRLADGKVGWVPKTDIEFI